MPGPRVYVDQTELETNIGIWLTLLAQRRASVLRDLWTRRGEDFDKPKMEHARREFARFIAGKVLAAGHELTRDAVGAELDRGNYELMKLARRVD